MNPDKLENFERAFRLPISSCRRVCECGMEFFNDDDGAWDWERGELELLRLQEQQGKAKGVSYSVGVVEFDGKEYVDGCTCWHDRVEKIIAWVDEHRNGIAKYLNAEKARKVRIAEASPTVDEP